MSEQAKPFQNNWDHLSQELVYLDLLLRREVLRWRRGLPKQSHDIFKTVYVNDAEIDRLLSETSTSSAAEPDQLTQIEAQATACRELIEQSKQASLREGIFLSLAQLARSFRLSPFEERIVMICLAPEIELKYERIYAYLQDDISRRAASIDLVLKLLCKSPEERVRLRLVFSAQANLFSSHILRYRDANEEHVPARALKLDERISSYLLGGAAMDSEITACTRTFTLETSETDELSARLGRLAVDQLHAPEPSSTKLIFHFQGEDGSGRRSLAARICNHVGVPMLVIDLRHLTERSQTFEESLRRIFREGILRPAAIYIDQFDSLLEDQVKAGPRLRSVLGCVEDFSWLTFIATVKPWEPAGLFQQHHFFAVELPLPGVTARAEILENLAQDRGINLGSTSCAELAAKFRLSPGAMRNALTAARDRARLRAPDAEITTDDVHHGCRSQSNQKLAGLSRKLKPVYTWADIVLPVNSFSQLREICAQMEHRHTVYGKWGFGEKQSLGRGLCVLLFGPSGTGKTMAVEIIANDLNLDAYKIDLSTVVSKYIGETEKNLNAVFSEAETSNAILFFDEADALFGRRSEVKDAHDRYANIEINYLLQRMEEFEGLAILATNQRKNMDDAFFRRMHFAVEFPFPDQEHRLAIWKQHFPQKAPVADDIDFNFFASQFTLAGGNIRNIVVNAAFLAAANSGVIGMQHLVQATRREFNKIGRLCTDADFAPYHKLIFEAHDSQNGQRV